MITADEAHKISITNNLEFIDKKIKEAAEKGQRKLSLKGCIRLSQEEINMLQDKGFNITTGHSGKGGEFDIINW